MKQGVLKLKQEEFNKFGTDGVGDLIKEKIVDKPFSFEVKHHPETRDYLIMVTTD